MPTPKKTRMGTWETYVYIGRDAEGKRKYKHITAYSRKDCEQKIAEYANAKSSGMELPVMQMTVGECVDRYIARKEGILSPKTIREYYSYRQSSFEELWDVPLQSLTENAVQEAIDRFAENHSPKSVKNRWGLFCASIGYYWRGFDFRIELPKIKRKRLDMPERADIERLLKDVQGHYMEIPVLLAITCGMRRGEISALDLDNDIDYQTGVISINKDMVLDKDGVWIVKEPKTEAGRRSVPCPPFVVDKIMGLKNRGGKLPNPNTITKWWWQNRSEYGITCTFHGLRHYYVSVMTALGCTEADQMERVGHTTRDMLKRYQEYLAEKEAEVNKDMANYFDEFGEKLYQ